MELLEAYVAGLVDGEGTITLSRDHKGSRRIPVVSVTSTTRELIDLLHENYGGQVRRHKTYREHHKTSYMWSVRHNSAIVMAARIRPYLRVPEKQRRADMLIHRYKAVTVRNGKYSLQQLRAKLDFEQEFFHPSAP